MVTGTNGKTTTCRMLEQMAPDAGRDCFAARLQPGARHSRGLCVERQPLRQACGRCAVIECDEAAFRRSAGEIKPAVAVVTNVFRDQLDRYGEVTHTLSGIREGLAQLLNSGLPERGLLADRLPRAGRAGPGALFSAWTRTLAGPPRSRTRLAASLRCGIRI